MKKYDYLIAGQGIAGTTLALHLLKRGKRVLVADAFGLPSSSRIAAGIFNPITGLRIVKTWLADAIFPYLHTFYSDYQQQFSTSFFYPQKIYRLFESLQNQNLCVADSADSAAPAYSNIFLPPQTPYPTLLKDDFGGIEILHGGHLDVPLFLQKSKEYFIAQEAFIPLDVEETTICWEKEHLSWQGMQFDKLILCRGTQETHYSSFNFLPFRPVKGEILHLHIDTKYNFNHIINRGCWLLPLGNGFYKAGSTYNHEDHSLLPTETAKKVIMDKLEEMLPIPFEVIHQEACLRPATLTRRPFLRFHPQNDKLFIFNGLGTKGISLAPYLAAHVADVLLSQIPILKEGSIIRYTHKI